MDKPTLSIVMICKNAERHLPEVLGSASFADEIVIVDSGSTDKTAEIARDLTEHFYTRSWTGYSDQKNFAMEKSGCDWILILDSDEVIRKETQEEIKKIIAENPGENCFEIVFDNIIFGKDMGGVMTKPVLFRRGKAKFKGKVHEKLLCEKPWGKLENRILHYAYDDLKQYFEKFNTYTSLDATQLLEGGRRSIVWVLVYGMLYRGSKDFARRYLYHGLWRHGFEGFLFSLLSGLYRVVQYAKYALMIKEKRK
jgi:glycosyltransferase involved in cell wall biosynthesis